MSTEEPSPAPPPSAPLEENPYASSRVSGRPEPGRVSVLAVIGIVLATIASSFVAFCCTCFPIGLMTFTLNSLSGLLAAIGIGVVAAVGIGFLVARALWRRITLN